MEFFNQIATILTTPNENLPTIITCSPIAFLDIYLIMLLFTTVLNINSNKKQRTLYTIIFTIFCIISRLFIPNPYGTFINIIVAPLLIIYIFKTTILKAIIAEVFPLIVTVGLETLFMNLYIKVFDLSYDDVFYVPVFHLMIMFSIYLTIYILSVTLKYFKLNINVLENMDKRNKILLVFNFIFAIILICVQLYLTAFYNNVMPFYITLLNVISIISFFLLSLYSLTRTTKLELTKRNLEESQLYNKTLTILHDNIRCFKHDFSNIIQAIGGYVQTEDLEGLKRYYAQLLEDCQKVTTLNVLNPELINNPAIYSLLTSKYYDADANGITFNIDIFMDLSKINMKEYEFSKILGILLDNAIEASKECEEKIINLTLRLDPKVNRQLLIIENTYKEKDIDTEKIYEKSYSTKPNNTGLGLWEVRKILKKNNNLNLFTTKDDKFFKQQLEIYL